MHSTMPNPPAAHDPVSPQALRLNPIVRPHAHRVALRGPSTHTEKNSRIAPQRGASPHVVLPASLVLGTPTVHEIADEVEAALSQSSYPLRDVYCRCDGDELILAGRTTRYYYVQVALTLAMSLAGQRRVMAEIEVRPQAAVEQRPQ